MDRAVQKANYVRHISCDKCGSSDANAEYDDGSTYCFSCETYQAPEPDGDTTAAQTQPTGIRQSKRAYSRAKFKRFQLDN